MFAFRWLAAGLIFVAALSPTFAASQAGVEGHDVLDRKFQSAEALFNSGQYPAAQQELEALDKAVPNSFDVLELLGLVYSAEGQEEKATPLLEHAVRLRPQSGPARNNLATNLVRRGKMPLAEKEFKKVVELEPASFDANHNLGAFYLRTGNIAAAIPTWKKPRARIPPPMTMATIWRWRARKQAACRRPEGKFSNSCSRRTQPSCTICSPRWMRRPEILWPR
jgi:tetratricopeptide (TPR) repeat protein